MNESIKQTENPISPSFHKEFFVKNQDYVNLQN